MIIGSREIYFDTLPSTNSYATALTKFEKPSEGTIVRAGFQTGGRGQTGNRWESESGKNLLISIILYPLVIKPDDQFLISMAVSLAICDFSESYISSSRIKWPNDIYVNDDKIAGILIENSIMGNHIENCVAGIGYNINQKVFKEGATNPVSLRKLTGKEYNIDECYKRLTESIEKRYKQLLTTDFDKIRSEYARKLYRINEWHNYEDSTGRFAGRIVSVSENGLLRIEKKFKDSISEYSFKEVEFIP